MIKYYVLEKCNSCGEYIHGDGIEIVRHCEHAKIFDLNINPSSPIINCTIDTKRNYERFRKMSDKEREFKERAEYLAEQALIKVIKEQLKGIRGEWRERLWQDNNRRSNCYTNRELNKIGLGQLELRLVRAVKVNNQINMEKRGIHDYRICFWCQGTGVRRKPDMKDDIYLYVYRVDTIKIEKCTHCNGNGYHE